MATLTFIPVDAQQQIKSATALLVALSKATDNEDIRNATRRAASLLLQHKPEHGVNPLVLILMDLFDLQGYARCNGKGACADAIEGIRQLLRTAYESIKDCTSHSTS